MRGLIERGQTGFIGREGWVQPGKRCDGRGGVVGAWRGTVVKARDNNLNGGRLSGVGEGADQCAGEGKEERKEGRWD